MRFIKIVLIISALTTLLFARDIPKLKGRVNDYANLLSSKDKRDIERYLVDVEQSTSSQLVVLTINSLEGDNLEDFSMRVANKWKVGQASLNNGAILIVSKRDKKIRIEVGYGLEPYLTDAKSSYIIRKAIVPNFKANNFSNGIKEGIAYMGGIVTKEFEISDAELAKFNRQNRSSKKKGGIPIGSIIFLVIIIFGNIGRRRGSGGGLLSGLLLGSMLGSSGRSSGGFSGGSGFGGFSGGGGGFGGGGASGGW